MNIILNQSVSIIALKKLIKQGVAVIRTGHIGNHYLSNLLLLACGIPAQIYDRNMHGGQQADCHYYPGHIFQNGKMFRISNDRTCLAPYMGFATEIDESLKTLVNSSSSPAHLHIQSLQQLFGKENVWTESCAWSKYSQMISKIVHILRGKYPTWFKRHISTTGNVMSHGKHQGDYSIYVDNLVTALAQIAEGADIQSIITPGIAPHINAMLLINTIVHYMETGNNTIYELSGPSFIAYALERRRKREIQDAYELLRKHMPELPEELTLTVVPTFHFRFGCLESEHDKFSDMLANIRKYHDLKNEKRSIIKSMQSQAKENDAPLDTDKMWEIKRTYDEQMNICAKAVHSCPTYNRIFFSLDNPPFFSQYDLLSTGEQLVVPECMQEMTFEEIDSFFKKAQLVKTL